jgi:hypothetical protein
VYCVVYEIAAPAEMYHQVHAEVNRRLGDQPAVGMLTHLGLTTDSGFQVIEVWETREDCERFSTAYVAPAIATVAPEGPADQPPPREPEVLGLQIGPAGASLAAETASMVPGARSAEVDKPAEMPS